MKKIVTIDVGDWSLYEVQNLLDSMNQNKPYIPMTKIQRFKRYQIWDILEVIGYALAIGSILTIL